MYWVSRHYLALLNVVMLFYFGLPLLAPALMNAGLETPAKIIYTIYKPLCHQFAFRSFFLFGEQAYYPLAEAGIPNVRTFEEAINITDIRNPNSYARLEARNFIGDETVGYKMALCERDMAIYGAIFLFGILYALTNKRFPPLPWQIWLLVGVLPVAIDGLSQLLSQPRCATATRAPAPVARRRARRPASRCRTACYWPRPTSRPWMSSPPGAIYPSRATRAR